MDKEKRPTKQDLEEAADREAEAAINFLVTDAKRIGVEPGWLWLYRNGFAHRVPEEVQEKIEKTEKKGRHIWEK